MDYGRILGEALRITWRRRELWVLGFLHALFAGGLQYNLNFSSSTFQGRQIEDFFNRFPNILDPGFIIALVAGFTLFLLVAIFVNSLTQAGLIAMVGESAATGQTTVAYGFSQGWKDWWRLVAIWIIVFVPFAFVSGFLVAILIVPAVLSFTAERVLMGVLILIFGGGLLFLLLLAIGIPLGIIEILAQRSVVLERATVFGSLGSAYRLFRKQTGRTLLFWVIMFGLGMALSLGYLIVYGTLALPVTLAAGSNLGLSVALSLPGILLLFFITSLIQIFTTAGWTLFFQAAKEQTPAESPDNEPKPYAEPTSDADSDQPLEER